MSPEPDAMELADLIRARVQHFDSDDGRRWFIVERDIPIADHDLETYCQQFLQQRDQLLTGSGIIPELSKAIAVTKEGRPIRWVAGVRLTWWVDVQSFDSSERAVRAEGYLQAAADEWNAVAERRSLRFRFSQATDAGTAVFRVRFHPFLDGTYAVAFFPNAGPADRSIRVGPLLLDATAEFDPIGVMRHELGHILGLRHEHISPDSPDQIEAWITGGVGAAELTRYDPQSVMHYPLSPGHGTIDFQITDEDEAGVARLYQFPPEDVIECAP